jgi:hypothetical protein
MSWISAIVVIAAGYWLYQRRHLIPDYLLALAFVPLAMLLYPVVVLLAARQYRWRMLPSLAISIAALYAVLYFMPGGWATVLVAWFVTMAPFYPFHHDWMKKNWPGYA